MKLIAISRVLALLTLLAMIATAQEKQAPSDSGNGSSSAAPAMVIESLTHDFGEVKPGTALRYAFKIKNEGKGDLLINNVAPS